MDELRTQVIFLGTSGFIGDRSLAAVLRDQRVRPTVGGPPTVTILDLSGAILTPGVLQEFILPVAQRIRGGEYGKMILVVTTPDRGIADFLGYLATAHNVAFYVAPSPDRISEAQPVGEITTVERQTLDVLVEFGGRITAAEFATHVGIEPTAAGNRLVNLARKGYVHRINRPRPEGDLYIEPRAAATPQADPGSIS